MSVPAPAGGPGRRGRGQQFSEEKGELWCVGFGLHQSSVTSGVSFLLPFLNLTKVLTYWALPQALVK